MDRQPARIRRSTASQARTGGLRHCAWLALALALGPAPLLAGDPPLAGHKPPASGFDLSQGFGAQWVDGELWAGGPGFKAHFEMGGVEFTPALGKTAPRNFPLALSVRSVQRGDTLLWDAGSSSPASPSLAGSFISYARQPGLTERYEVRRDGLEQSFVLDSLPAGEGDLLVRLALDTELEAQRDGAGWRFTSEFGGVRYGAVTGADASNRRVAGEVRVMPTALGPELLLSLPASFVDTADYPLVLDPEITPIFPLGPDPLTDEESPDVSFDDSIGRWLTVYARVFSLSDSDIRAQSFMDDGNLTPAGYWLVEIASNTVARHPSVASLQAYSRWFIAWEQAPTAFSPNDIYGCSISTFLNKSNTVLIAGTAADEKHADVGGHSSEQPTVVSVVWEASGAILHRTIFLANDPVVDLAAVTEVLVPSNASNPRIAASGGGTMRLLVVCELWWPTPAPGDHDIRAVLIDVLGHPLVSADIVSTIGPDERAPDVDGDGTDWMLSWAWAPTSSTFFNSVRARRVTSSAGTLLPGPVLDIVQGALGGDHGGPSVAATGNGYLVAFAKQVSGFNYDIALVGVDHPVSQILDPLTYVGAAPTSAQESRLGSRYDSGHAAGDGAFLVWQTWDLATSDGEVWGCVVEPSFGNVTNLGGASTGGGQLTVSPPKAGAFHFLHQYDGVYPGNPVTMLISPFSLNAPFCTGVLHVDPTTAFTLVLLTDANGDVLLDTPIPADPVLLGLTLYEQWSEKDTFAPPCGKKIRLSNALALEIE